MTSIPAPFICQPQTSPPPFPGVNGFKADSFIPNIENHFRQWQQRTQSIHQLQIWLNALIPLLALSFILLETNDLWFLILKSFIPLSCFAYYRLAWAKYIATSCHGDYTSKHRGSIREMAVWHPVWECRKGGNNRQETTSKVCIVFWSL